MGLPILGILGSLVGPVTKLIDGMHTSDEEKAEAKLKLLEALQSQEKTIVEAQKEIIKTEAGSKHWITSAWRPILMLSFTAIVINNYIIAPYLSEIFNWSVALSLPPDMWQLLKIGVGGYVVGRSGEKAINVWKNK